MSGHGKNDRSAYGSTARRWRPECLVFIGLAVCMALCSRPSYAGQDVCRYYVGPATAEAGEGTSESSPAFYLDESLWKAVQESLRNSPVTVQFIPGLYVQGHLRLHKTGNPEHRLILEGVQGRTVFEILEDSEVRPSSGLYIRYSRNIGIRNFSFTGSGHTGFISHVLQSSDITFEGCSWYDLPNMKYGATGSSGNNLTPETIDQSDTRHIIFKDCSFQRVGLHSGAHMIYNAYGGQDVQVLDCRFEDCSGDYVRFRDLTDYGVVRGCTFISTGTYPPGETGHRCFIAIRTYNDVDPGDEWLGTHFYFAENRFVYDVTEETPDFGRYPLIIFNSGFDPPNRRHLLTPEEGLLLKEGTDSERKQLLKANFGIDMSEFHVFSNEYSGEVFKAICGSKNAYHSPTRGWTGQEDVSGLLNDEPMPFEQWYEQMMEVVGQ